jgi:hypothetical protein
MTNLQDTNYKTIYNVASCAGITNTDMSDVENVLNAYQKAASWINDELGDIFTASITTLSSSRYRLDLLTETGAGLSYGYLNLSTSGGSHQLHSVSVSSSTRYNCETIPFVNLRLMLIRSSYGFIAGFFNSTDVKSHNIRLMCTTGIDSTDTEKPITAVLYKDYIYLSLEPTSFIDCGSFGSCNSYSEKTGLFTFMAPKTDFICDNVRECHGNVPGDHTLFEADDKVWCAISTADNYKALALRME